VALQRNNNFARPERRGGFTLLELLIAMAMAGIVTLVLFQALKVVSQARNSTERALAPSRAAQVALDMLRQDFQNVPPCSKAADGTTTSETTAATLASSFTGTQSADDRGHEADVIDFYTLSDGQLVPVSQAVGNRAMGGAVTNNSTGYGTNGNWMPASEVKAIEITIEVPDGMTDHCLVRKVWHNISPLNQNQTINPDEEEVICRGVQSFTVRYFDGTEWQDTWDSTTEDNQIPAALEITLEMDRPVLTASDRNTAPMRYVQVIQLPCSNVVNDTNVSGTVSGLGGFGQ
jgi:prepilin-type N-terminal cleavage/methylation domain-containing protein